MGKSSGAAPQTPDPEKLIGTQSAADRLAFNYQTNANRYDQIGPDSSTTWDKTPSFDQAGYDAALADWNKGNTQGTWNPGQASSGMQYDPITGQVTQGQATEGFWSGATGNTNALPDKQNFTSYDWAQKTTLSPEQQKIHDLNQNSQIGQAGLLEALTQRLKGTYSQGVDYSGLPGLRGSMDTSNIGDMDSYEKRLAALDPTQFNQQASDAAYNSSTRYLDPQVQTQQKALEARLSEQGFVPGTPGYDQAMRSFQDGNARTYADARDRSILTGNQVGQSQFGSATSALQAALQASKLGFDSSQTDASFQNTARSQAIAELLQQRAQPLNELNSLRSGTQTNNGTIGGQAPVGGGAAQLAPVDTIGAYGQQYKSLMDKYNAGVASDNADTQAGVQIAGLLAMLAMSDARLKTNIKQIGTTEGGVGIYEYDIFDRKEIGVMAQELLVNGQASAVTKHKTGYYMVDYSKVR